MDGFDFDFSEDLSHLVYDLCEFRPAVAVGFSAQATAPNMLGIVLASGGGNGIGP